LSIFDLLEEDTKQQKQQQKTKRAELLKSVGVKECFTEGSMNIDMRKCLGVECNLCVKACPTNALYWKGGEIATIEDLCVYCGACVANCCVDNCIKVTRKREDGTTETFSTPKAVCQLMERINLKKRRERVKSRYPTVQEYLDRYF
jgi:ferredoxin